METTTNPTLKATNVSGMFYVGADSQVRGFRPRSYGIIENGQALGFRVGEPASWTRKATAAFIASTINVDMTLRFIPVFDTLAEAFTHQTQSRNIFA